MNTYYPGYNPYLQNQFQPQGQRFQQPDQQYVNQMNMQPQTAPVTPIYKPTITGLQGKSVDSLDVVKAMDIPLDGTISYFPLTDGTAIITKQLQQDGTSKTIVYKPTEVEQPLEQEIPKYITPEELDAKLKDINIGKDLKDDVKSLKKQIKDLTFDFQKLSEKLEEED